MPDEIVLRPDYIFEVSWEVCNKVGGIYTVISTKALTLVNEWQDKVIMIGPDVWKGTGEHPEFAEDKELFKSWRPDVEALGLKIKIGRWKIAGNPIVILVDFTSFFTTRDKIFEELWLKYHLDSLTGQWDYIEPALFGYVTGKVIESFYHHYITFSDRIVAQFHEWMTGAGILYLHEHVPQAGTVFTTHATVVGRCLAGNNLPLYSKFDTYVADEEAKKYNIIAKHSLEKLSAQISDCFTTVSDITARECEKFLEKKPDVITPNGFEASFVPDQFLFREKRINARNKLLQVAGKLVNKSFGEDTMLVLKSGRYEFRNKGIDLFIDALGLLKQSPAVKEVLAFIFVPAYHTGPRKELVEGAAIEKTSEDQYEARILTHYLQGEDTDPIMNAIKKNELKNLPGYKVNVIFAPTYLDGNDGVFNLSYFDLLIGFDFTVFPSYYEPWGYTPVESVAFHIPTVISNLTGFSRLFTDADKGIYVLKRDDFNGAQVTSEIADLIRIYATKPEAEISELREDAFRLSRKTLWKNLIIHYREAYSTALNKAKEREGVFIHEHKVEQLDTHALETETPRSNEPQWRKIYVQAKFPEVLLPLKKLSMNVWWTWNYEAEELFKMISEKQWKLSEHNPVALIEYLSYDEIKSLEANKIFLNKLKSVSAKLERYLQKKNDPSSPLIAYFCMEFGLHSSIKIYSGGLGILAGDYLKQASDSGVNIIGVGLLYRNGYFRQKITLMDEQVVEDDLQKFTDLPMEAVKNEDGDLLKITIAFPGRTLHAQAWKMEVGNTKLFLLDTDIPENTAEDRAITSNLYGGTWENRLRQEILLGIGGVRLVSVLGYKPNVYHCNEGHAAFVSIERIYRHILERNISFDEAFEVVRASSLFTTHTPVEAGHDKFSEDMLRAYFSHYPDIFNIPWKKLMGLGRANPDNNDEPFSMSYFAAHMSKEINGVSKIHGDVTRRMFSKLWEGYEPEEAPIGYVTNGVHLYTWLANEWKQLYSNTLGDLSVDEQSSSVFWKGVHDIRDREIWQTHCSLKKKLIAFIKEKSKNDLIARHDDPEKLAIYEETLTEDALFIGFARRFVTYKRPDLLFKNINELTDILNNDKKPVIFLFSGKSHPNDVQSQQIIFNMLGLIKKNKFDGKIIFLENYDMEVARYLVQGVDVWLNNPVPGLEASGTSGMKASMNGILNFSVLDGWWPEAFNKNVGWALEKEDFKDPSFRDKTDAEQIYRILKKEIIPLYFKRDDDGLPVDWIQKMKNAIAEISPAFNMERMLTQYFNNYYKPLNNMHHEMVANRYEKAKELAAWKQKIRKMWNKIKILSVNVSDSSGQPFPIGKNLTATVTLDINGLAVSDLAVEVIIRNSKSSEEYRGNIVLQQDLQPVNTEGKEVTWHCSLPMARSGVFEYGFRIYPKNPLLLHRQDAGLLQWV